MIRRQVLKWAHSIIAFCLNTLEIQAAIGVGPAGGISG